MISHIKRSFRLQFKKQKILIRISFSYSRVELNILLSHLKDFSSLKNSLFATIIKTKIRVTVGSGFVGLVPRTQANFIALAFTYLILSYLYANSIGLAQGPR